MPLLRITSPSSSTALVLEVLQRSEAVDVSVVRGASVRTGGDLVLAEVPRGAVDAVLAALPSEQDAPGLFVAVEDSEALVSSVRPRRSDDEAVVWAQVVQDVHEAGRLSWVNVSLVVMAAAIAALGIIQDQLLLIVGAMALSPDYFPIADACLAVARRAWTRAVHAVGTLVFSLAAGAVGAWILTEALSHTVLAATGEPPSGQLTEFISSPDALSVVVALFAGVAGALAVTLPGSRGLVGVFVSITTIPAAANIGVALAAANWPQMFGASVQLLVNVASLLVAGTLTLSARRALGR